MGIICSVCCCKKNKNDYKKLEATTPDSRDVEAGGGDDFDDETWDDFPDTAVPQGNSSAGVGAGVSVAGTEEPPPDEPEDDPFAGMGMAPKIVPTKRHAAVSAWAQQQLLPATSRFALDEEPSSVAGDGWGDDLGDFGMADRKRAAEQRREQRRLTRGADASTSGNGGAKKERLKVAATKVSSE